MVEENEKKVKERETERKRKEADTTHLELSTEGKGLGGEDKRQVLTENMNICLPRVQ